MPSTTDDSRYQLYVVELADTVGPRRHPDRPNLYVGATGMEPDERFRRDLLPSAKPRHGVRPSRNSSGSKSRAPTQAKRMQPS